MTVPGAPACPGAAAPARSGRVRPRPGTAAAAGSGRIRRHGRRRSRPGWWLPVLAAATVALATIAAWQISRVAGPARPAVRVAYRTPAPSAALVRHQAAAWVRGQVSRSAIIACDPAMCSALAADGIATGSLLVLGPEGSASPLGSNLVVATAAVRGLLGTRLAGVYAPLVLASFGAAGTLIQVRVVAPDGSAAYLRALRSDRLARRAAAAQLLSNRHLVVTAAARRQLSDGSVDARVLTTLAALAQLRPLRVVAFAGPGPGASADAPLSTVVLTTAGPASGGPATGRQATSGPAAASPATASHVTGGQATGWPDAGSADTGGPATGGPATGGPVTGGPVTGGPSAGRVAGSGSGGGLPGLRSLLAFLRVQQPPFRAASVRTERLRGGQQALRIGFADPSPLGLLPTGGSPLPGGTGP